MPSASHALTVEPANPRDFATNSLFGEAMFTRYGAWATSGPNPEPAQLSRKAAASSSVTRGPAHPRGLETKICAASAPPETAFLDGAGDPAGTASDVRPDPHTRYRVIGSPYVSVAPTGTLWFVTTVPGYAAASTNVTCSPY